MISYSRDDLLDVAGEVVHGALFLFSGQTISMIIAGIASIIIAHLLGPSLYRAYSLSLVIPSFLLIFTYFGVSPALTRYSAMFRVQGNISRLISFIRYGFTFKFLVSSTLLFFRFNIF